MDQSAHYQSNRIEPCTSVDDGSGGRLSTLFHLLTCGHIIAIDDQDKRCGRNCQQAADWVASYAPSVPVMDHGHTPHSLANTLPPLSVTQAQDILYCETCNGIPFDRYRIMTSPNPSNLNAVRQAPTVRRALALTRQIIQITTSLDPAEIDALLCSPFFNPEQEGFDGKNTHYLRCGHEVWSVPQRPCAANCTDIPGCRGASFPRNDQQNDVILCQECVTRSELVFQRYAHLGLREDEEGNESVDERPSAGLS